MSSAYISVIFEMRALECEVWEEISSSGLLILRKFKNVNGAKYVNLINFKIKKN